MSNNPNAKQTLENFVKTYRNPDYTCTASSAQEMQDGDMVAAPYGTLGSKALLSLIYYD